MTKKTTAKPAEPERVRVEAVAMFRHDGIYRRPGEVVEMTRADAADLIAVGFAVPMPPGYARRDMQAKS